MIEAMRNYITLQESVYDPTKLAIRSILPQEVDLVTNCGDNCYLKASTKVKRINAEQKDDSISCENCKFIPCNYEHSCSVVEEHTAGIFLDPSNLPQLFFLPQNVFAGRKSERISCSDWRFKRSLESRSNWWNSSVCDKPFFREVFFFQNFFRFCWCFLKTSQFSFFCLPKLEEEKIFHQKQLRGKVGLILATESATYLKTLQQFTPP